MKNETFWSRPLIAAYGAVLFTYLSHVMLVGTLPAYIVSLGGDKPTAGLVVSIFSLTALLARPLFGRLLDRTGRRFVLLCGAALFALGTIFQFFFSGIVPILLLRVVQGLGFSAVTTSAGVVVSDLVRPQRLSDGLGWLQIIFAADFAVGPTAGLALYGSFGYHALYAAAIVLAALGLACALGVRYEADRPQAHGAKHDTDGKPLGGAGRAIIAIAGVSFFIQMSMGCVIAFIPLYGKFLNIGSAAAFFFPAYAAASIVGVRTLGGGKIAERFGIERILIPCMLITVGAMAGISTAGSAAAFLICGLLFGLGFVTTVTLTGTELMRACPAGKRGTANAINFAAMDIAMTVGPFGAGLIAQYAGYRLVYAAAAVSALCGLGVFLAFVRGRALK